MAMTVKFIDQCMQMYGVKRLHHCYAEAALILGVMKQSEIV